MLRRRTAEAEDSLRAAFLSDLAWVVLDLAEDISGTLGSRSTGAPRRKVAGVRTPSLLGAEEGRAASYRPSASPLSPPDRLGGSRSPSWCVLYPTEDIRPGSRRADRGGAPDCSRPSCLVGPLAALGGSVTAEGASARRWSVRSPLRDVGGLSPGEGRADCQRAGAGKRAPGIGLGMPARGQLLWSGSATKEWYGRGGIVWSAAGELAAEDSLKG